MKKLFIICLVFATLSISGFSQSRKKARGTTISVATTINYYPAIAPYSFFSSFTTSRDDLLLTFLTANSGTFVIEDGQSVFIERESKNDFPTQLVGIGGSVQIKKGNSLFHEISLTKLSFTKSSNIVNYTFLDSLGEVNLIRSGYKQNVGVFGFRYELGRYFGKRKSAKFRFGISGGIEPSFYFYKRTPLTTREYPVRGKIFTVEVAVIPMVSAKLSKKVSMDFKIIPNVLMADFGSIDEKNPTVPIRQQEGSREYNLPEINLAFSLVLRYTVKETKKRRG